MAIRVRPMRDDDRLRVAEIFADVAAERDGIGTEPPVDVEERAARWDLEGSFVAELDGEVVGHLHIHRMMGTNGELGMHIAKHARGVGAGSALMEASIRWAREQGLHKISLSVWPHNAAALALYRKFGFVEEGRRVKHWRRQSGELWDMIDMGLLL